MFPLLEGYYVIVPDRLVAVITGVWTGAGSQPAKFAQKPFRHNAKGFPDPFEKLQQDRRRAVTRPSDRFQHAGHVPCPPPEQMDGDHLSYEETRRALRDLRRVNRWLWGYPSVVRSLLPGLRTGQRVLDVGTGSGDVAAAVYRAAQRRGTELRMVGVDFKLGHLAIGRQWHPKQLRVVAAADALPFAVGAFDHTFSSLFFHHFGSESNAAIVAEMRRVSRVRAVIVDLRRSLLLRLVISPLLCLLGAGPVATFDGRASVACAWPLSKVRSFRSRAPGEVRRRFPFRFALTLPGGGGSHQASP